MTDFAQEHHLQAALSSASLLHSSPKPPSPTQSTTTSTTTAHRQPSKPEPTVSQTLNYHIPTPDATGLVENADYAKLYQTHRYAEPLNYIKFSDTVEESSGGWGGLGYCMDDDDTEWLNSFNAKAEGSSGTANAEGSPLKETSQNQPASASRERRNPKGKDKEEKAPTPISINPDTFEYVMGVMEKYAEDRVPTLHTVSLTPGPSLRCSSAELVSTADLCRCRISLFQPHPSHFPPFHRGA